MRIINDKGKEEDKAIILIRLQIVIFLISRVFLLYYSKILGDPMFDLFMYFFIVIGLIFLFLFINAYYGKNNQSEKYRFRKKRVMNKKIDFKR